MSTTAISMNPSVELVPERTLKDHEEVDRRRLRHVRLQMVKTGRVSMAPVVDRATLVVLDGHHRVNALRSLGAALVPVCLVDYMSPEIEVHSWGGHTVTKEDVMHAALSGKKFPPRTTKHMVRLGDGSLRRIAKIAPKVDFELKDLMPPLRPDRRRAKA